MSGGGGRVNRGGMSSKVASEVDPKQLQEWENQLKKVRNYTHMGVCNVPLAKQSFTVTHNIQFGLNK